MTDSLVKEHLSNSQKLQSKKRKSIDKDTMDYNLIRKRINKLNEIEIKQIEQAKELSSEFREKIDENQRIIDKMIHKIFTMQELYFETKEEATQYGINHDCSYISDVDKEDIQSQYVTTYHSPSEAEQERIKVVANLLEQYNQARQSFRLMTLGGGRFISPESAEPEEINKIIKAMNDSEKKAIIEIKNKIAAYESEILDNEKILIQYIPNQSTQWIRNNDVDTRTSLIFGPQTSILWPIVKPRTYYRASAIPRLDEKESNTLQKILKDTSPFLNKKKLSWALIERATKPKQLNQYLSQFTKTTYSFGTETCQLYDLTKANDYRFIVNTVISRPERLQELVKGEPTIFDATPFVSSSLIDKSTRVFAGGHQHNFLSIPLYLALEVNPDSIVYMGPTDIGFPLW